MRGQESMFGDVAYFAHLERNRQRMLPEDDPSKLPEYGRRFPMDDFCLAAIGRIEELKRELDSVSGGSIGSESTLIAIGMYEEECVQAAIESTVVADE